MTKENQNSEFIKIPKGDVYGQDPICKKMVPSPHRLKEILDNYEDLDATSEMTIDLIYKGALWLAFSGIPIEYAVQITPDSVDFFKKWIISKMGVHRLYNESIPELKLLCECDILKFNHPFYQTDRKRMDGNEILRGFIKLTPYYIVQNLSFHFNKNKEYAFNYNSILMSGIFYRAYQLELLTGEVDLSELLSLYILTKRSISSSRDSDITSDRIYTQGLYRQYLKKYNKWKEAFGL